MSTIERSRYETLRNSHRPRTVAPAIRRVALAMGARAGAWFLVSVVRLDEVLGT